MNPEKTRGFEQSMRKMAEAGPKDTPDAIMERSYDAADRMAREASEVAGNKEAQAKMEQIKKVIHGGVEVGMPKSVSLVDTGYANARAEGSMQRDMQEMSKEMEVSATELKSLAEDYDLLSPSMKESKGLPKYFGEIAALQGKPPTTSGFKRFFRENFTGYGARKEMFDKAMELLASSDTKGLPNSEGGIVAQKAASAKRESNDQQPKGLA